MDYEKMRLQVHTGIDRYCASLSSDPHRVQRVLNVAHGEGRKTVKKKISFVMVFLVLFMLLSITVAVAAMMGWGHIEKSMDMAVEFGPYGQWSLEAKMKLIASMKEDGLEIAQKDWQDLQGTALNEQEKHELADEILTGYYGEKEFLYYYTIATTEWGEPQTWDLEQRHWFYKTQREKGLLLDNFWVDILPEEGDFTQQQAEEMAKQEVARVYGLSEEELAHLHGDVSFFITEDYAIPRWSIHLYEDDNVWATKYSVLLTREGEVTEDAEHLGILTPEHEKQRQEKQESSAAQKDSQWEKTAKRRIEEKDTVYYNPEGGKSYHFLQDCPLVAEKYLPLTVLNTESSVFPLYAPCRACVQQNDLWPMQDKMKYGIGRWKTPGEDWIGEDAALHIACKAMEEQEIHTEGLYPVIGWSGERDAGEEYYVSFFAMVWQEEGELFLDPQYVVGVDAVSGQVVYVNDGNG